MRSLAFETRECPATGGVARGPLSASMQFAFEATAVALVEAVRRALFSGANEPRPYSKTSTNAAADGSARTTVATFSTQMANRTTLPEPPSSSIARTARPKSQALVPQNVVSHGLSTADLARAEARRKWRGGIGVEVVPDPMAQMVDDALRLEMP